MNKINLYPKLADFISQLDFETILPERLPVLQELIDYVNHKVNSDLPVRLNFICTHNSRRSQFSQIWAQVAADYYGVSASCHSGGVEVTAFNYRAVESIRRFGFQVSVGDEMASNPVYTINYGEDSKQIIAFSKLYDHPNSPSESFAAVMTCSHADENCPFIPGTEARIPVRFEDPKAFDDTDQETTMYDQRSRQIATEMFYVFSKVAG